MAESVLHVIAHVHAKPDRVEETLALLRGIVGPTRKESGCLRYDLLRNPADPAAFTFVEEWRGEADLKSHFEQPHMVAAMARVPELLTGPPDVRTYRQEA